MKTQRIDRLNLSGKAAVLARGNRLANLELSTLLAVFERSKKECRFFPQIAVQAIPDAVH
jgi:hypothetical protein